MSRANLSFLLISLTCIYLLPAAAAFGLQPKSEDKEMNARDAFWSAADLVDKPIPPRLKPHFPPKPRPLNLLGLRYSVLKQRPDNTFEEVSPDTNFHAGDKIRLSVISNQQGYLYVIEQGSSGAWLPLYPMAGSTGTNRLVPGQEYVVPDPGMWIFAGKPGQERVFVLLTRDPELDLDQTIASLQTSQGKQLSASDVISDELLDRIRQHVKPRDLVFTKSEDLPTSSTNNDQAVYVINKATKTADPHVVVDFVLTHD